MPKAKTKIAKRIKAQMLVTVSNAQPYAIRGVSNETVRRRRSRTGSSKDLQCCCYSPGPMEGAGNAFLFRQLKAGTLSTTT